MERKQNETDRIGQANYKSFLKGQEILKNSMDFIEIEQNKYKITINNETILSKKFKGFNKKLINKKIQVNKKLYSKSITTIYKNYKTFLIKSKYLLKKVSILKFKKYYEQKNFSKNSSKYKVLKYITTQYYSNFINFNRLNLVYSLKKLSRSLDRAFKIIIQKCLILTYLLQGSYLKSILKYEKSFLVLLNSIKKTYENYLLFLLRGINSNNSMRLFNKKFKNQIDTLTKLMKKPLTDIFSLNKKFFFDYLKRLGFVSYIYFLPFIYLASQALIPNILGYNYPIINPVSGQLFEKVPILIDLIKLFKPLIFNGNLQFWVLIIYFLIFPKYETYKLSYNVGYNGTTALTFLMINYTITLGQNIIDSVFQSIKIIKDNLFTSYLTKHLGKTKYKERELAFEIFQSLIKRYEFKIEEDFYNFLLFINHRIFSIVALISVSALVYNCLYYVVYNKNPKLLFITKNVERTIKNPKNES
uniref:Uncharacterized protein n=1 Tax=Monodopsis sp. MarTras21 TaxID=1745953 RepID=A0A1D8RDD8_9STRA|nr:hypothetical protein Ycf60 [Monodopsis sp. MarTras21]